MRFFSSSALASAEKLRLAANCSAAETIVLAPERPSCFRLSRPIGRIIYRKMEMPLALRKAGCRSRQAGSVNRLPSPACGGRWRGGGLRGRQERDRSTGFLNRCNCRFGCAMDGKLQRHLDFVPAEQTDAVLGAPQPPAPDQGLNVKSFLGVERPAIDRRLNAVEVHDIELKRENIVKAALRQPPMQRHLAAFEAFDAH